MKKLLIIGIGSVSLKYLVQALGQFGYSPLLLGRRSSFSEQIQSCLQDLEFHELDTSSVQSVIAFVHQHPEVFGEIFAITSLFDEMFPLIETVAQHFGWLSPGSVVASLSDKKTVLSLVPEFSPPSLCFTADQLPALDIDALSQLGDRLVIKPVLSSGGMGLKHLSSHKDLAGCLAEHIERSGFAAATEWVLQQELTGRLLSFEGYVEGGMVRRLGISSRSRVGFTEVANKYPAADDLDGAVAERGWDCIESLVHRSGYKYGYFHCEFIQTCAGVYLVDANIGRIGGATIVEQIALAHEIDTTDLLAHVLLMPLLKKLTPIEIPTSVRTPHKTLGIWYGIPVSGRLDQLQLAPIRSRHTQFAPNGTEVPCIGESDYAWVGMLSGHEDEVLSDIHSITLLTDKGSFKPAFSLD